MISSLTLQELHHHLSVSIIKVQKGINLHGSSLLQCNNYIIVYQFELSKFNKGINKLSNCNSL